MNRDIEKSRIASAVVETCRNRLYFTYRYLEQALFRLKEKESMEIWFGSDGQYLYYNDDYVLKRYIEDVSLLTGDYLHTVIHCLYQHPFFGKMRKRAYWDLAADMAAESIRIEIVGSTGAHTEDSSFYGVRSNAEHCKGNKELQYETAIQSRDIQCAAVIREAEKELALLSAQNLYIWLERRYEAGSDILGKELSELAALFVRDEHSCWYREENSVENGPGSGVEKGREIGVENRPGSGWRDKLPQEWRETAEKVMLTLQGFPSQGFGQGKLRGEQAGNLIRSLQALTREKYNYGEFLKKFARLEERMQASDEEFDYIYYTYGLRLYDSIPLVEPLEYREAYLIREFVIVVDTSGSCEGKLVELFLTKTYNILKQTESFGAKVNIHIIQCDARIQEDTRIASLKELEDYITGMSLKGFGGTDFRPAFQYVEELKKAGELKRMDGLIYFTDGYGVFPGAPPGYKTAFAFVKRDDDVRVPSWAMKIYLDEEGLR